MSSPGDFVQRASVAQEDSTYPAALHPGPLGSGAVACLVIGKHQTWTRTT